MLYVCFFFQAEDGIRDWSVTGVQTCALPILTRRANAAASPGFLVSPGDAAALARRVGDLLDDARLRRALGAARSEERRVGKEWRCRAARDLASDDDVTHYGNE